MLRTLIPALLLLIGCGRETAPLPPPEGAREPTTLDGQSAEWPAHGRTHREQRFSPLAVLRADNVGDLGLAWTYRTGTRRGLEATPIVVEGVLYATGNWGVVYALDSATGRELWRYDPEVPPIKGRDACCDVVNRGVAVWQGRVFVGTFDGRLVALDADSGDVIWEVPTFDPSEVYTITGAPRIADGRVIIGNGGADFGVRGYVSAYDAMSGEILWRFFTVPGPPDQPAEHPELEMAAETWPAESAWEVGLGGTVWDSIAYDPELELVFVGVGNGSPWDRSWRSPGGGDNLFLSSILALEVDTGRLVWHYQTTPGDHWDFTATQHMVLADLEIEGVRRRVLMQAPKNGFFYVLDRETGELLSAENYDRVTWATHVDPDTGRPVENPDAVWGDSPAFVLPGGFGAHNWHPMAFSPRTGWVYIPTQTAGGNWARNGGSRFQPGNLNGGSDPGEAYRTSGSGLGLFPCTSTHITAWDPIRQERVWRLERESSTPAGLLVTAGDLLFQGGSDGRFHAYDARSGDLLWTAEVGVGIIAPPISYAIDGEQYIAVMAGMGGGHGLLGSGGPHENDGRILAFKLGGAAAMLPVPERSPRVPEPPDRIPDPERVARGKELYEQTCMRCHGIPRLTRGLLPDLATADAETHELWVPIVLGGLRADRGMSSFADLLTVEQAEAIHAYIIDRAHWEPGFLDIARGLVATSVCIPPGWIAD